MRRWVHELLDSDDRVLRVLDGVTGGHCEVVAQSPLGGSGQVVIEQDRGVDWMSHRIRSTFHNGVTSWPVGVFLFAEPTIQHTAFGVRFDVGLLTKMNVIAEDTVDDGWAATAGTPIIPAVVSLIQSTGETRVAVTDSAAVLASPLVFEPGESKLTIINTLLQAAGYWSLWCDSAGLFRVEPYVDLASRPVSFEFEHGPKSIHYADWSMVQNLTTVPNKVIAWREGDGDAPALVGVATNEDPESPFSIPSRGRPITHVVSGVEAASQQVVDQIATRTLRDLMTPVTRMEVTHDMVRLEPNALVGFTPEDGVRRLATVQRMRFDFTFDTDVDAEWRLVNV